MRHAAGQIADSLHFLRLVRLRLELGSLGLLAVLRREVAQDAGKMTVAAGPPFGDRQMRREDGPVLAADFQLLHRPQIASRLTLRLLPHRRRQQYPHILPDELRRTVPGHRLGRLAEFPDDAVLVTDDDGVDRGLEDRPIAAFAFVQLLFDRRASLALAPQPDDEEPCRQCEHRPSDGAYRRECIEDFGSEAGHLIGSICQGRDSLD